MTVAVSTPRMKKVIRSVALFLLYLPVAKWAKSRKMPGASCKNAIISMEKTKIPTEVKTLMLRL